MFGSTSHRPSVMKHTFSEVPKAEIPRSSFDRSHGHKTTFDAGWLIPIYVDEALPGDTFNLKMTGFARLATPIFPIMDNMVMETQFFSVPMRLVWSNWQKFNGEQNNPGDSTDYLIPEMVAPVGGHASGSLADYMGIPPLVGSLTHSALWHRAYNLIYNTWYRDQNLQNAAQVDLGDGPDNEVNYILRRRGKRHDYFTSALPWPQKGPGVAIPLGTRANISGLGVDTTVAFGNVGSVVKDSTTSNAGVVYPASFHTGQAALFYRGTGTAATDIPDIYADLTTATAATINSLRQAFQIQKIFERDARGGTRYTEIIKAHFGVTSPDARLQRPEFLGGGSSPVNISPIPQTAPTNVVTPQGNLAAIGTALLAGHGFTTSFTEHCLILGIISVRADLTYQQGLNRMFSRRTRFDFYWPALAHIGEQAVLRKEIFASSSVSDNNIVFGYQERYAEYRYKPSVISGLFRANAPGTLDSWHLSQTFSSAPVLNATFIVEDPPVDRVIAVPSEPHFLFDSYFRVISARPMPVYGVPGLIDHF